MKQRNRNILPSEILIVELLWRENLVVHDHVVMCRVFWSLKEVLQNHVVEIVEIIQQTQQIF